MFAGSDGVAGPRRGAEFVPTPNRAQIESGAHDSCPTGPHRTAPLRPTGPLHASDVRLFHPTIQRPSDLGDLRTTLGRRLVADNSKNSATTPQQWGKVGNRGVWWLKCLGDPEREVSWCFSAPTRP